MRPKFFYKLDGWIEIGEGKFHRKAVGGNWDVMERESHLDFQLISIF